jgi:hypothetical protein
MLLYIDIIVFNKHKRFINEFLKENGALHMVPYFEADLTKNYQGLYGEEYINHHRHCADRYPPKYTLVQKQLVS